MEYFPKLLLIQDPFRNVYNFLKYPKGIQICTAKRQNIETYNNIARYNLIDTKYPQMAFRSPSDGALISPNQPSFGTPGQTKVSGDRQRETTHEICYLAAELLEDVNKSLRW